VTTIRHLVESSGHRLAAAGLDQPRREAWLLLGHVMARSRAGLMAAADESVPRDVAAQAETLVERRARGEPLAYLVGEKEFWSLALRVTPAVLIPRPDSETVVEAALAALPSGPAARILDLGTGSGCLLLAILSERPRVFGIGVDLSPAALDVARANAGQLGLASRTGFLASNWDAALAGSFDLIVSNPPYIRTDDLAALPRGIREYEPRRALAGGSDGLDAFRAIVGGASRLLRRGGWLGLEVGAGQADAVVAMLRAAGFVDLDKRRDLAGIDRCVSGRSAQ
jgi:release factor glutamine methyltransferase